MDEPEKIVFRLSRSVWKERSTLNKGKASGRDDRTLNQEEADERDTSPTLRRRSAPNKSAVFNPSGCNQCGTATTCNHCLRRKEQELQAIKSQYEAIQASQAILEKSKGAQDTSYTETVDSSPPDTEKNSKSCPNENEKESKSDDKSTNKRGRRRTISESVPTPEEALKHLNTVKSSFSCRMLQNYVDVAEYEVFLSAINSMTYENIFKHLVSLRVEYIQKLLRPALQSLMTHTRNNDIFNFPVDPEALGLKDYFVKITHPMDLGTVKRRLLQGYYHTVQSCVDDVTLVFRNATEYNHVQNIVHQAAVFLNNIFQEDMKSIHEKVARQSDQRNAHSCERCEGSACSFCGEKCHKLEPPIIVCHGPCGQRIKRLGIYYVSTDGAMVFCQKCYTTSGPVVSGEETPTSSAFSPRPTTPGITNCSNSSRTAPLTPSYDSQGHNITPGGSSGSGSQTPKPLMKKDMLKRRFDEEIFEPWIDCSTCHRRVHQVCALYNPFYDKSCGGETTPDATATTTTDNSNSSSSSSSSSSVIANANQQILEPPKMVTRKRGRHKKGTHLHLTDSRARAAAIAEEEKATAIADNNDIFQCAMCKLKTAINKSKRGKRGASRVASTSYETNMKKDTPAYAHAYKKVKQMVATETNIESGVDVALALPASAESILLPIAVTAATNTTIVNAATTTAAATTGDSASCTTKSEIKSQMTDKQIKMETKDDMVVEEQEPGIDIVRSDVEKAKTEDVKTTDYQMCILSVPSIHTGEASSVDHAVVNEKSTEAEITVNKGPPEIQSYANSLSVYPCMQETNNDILEDKMDVDDPHDDMDDNCHVKEESSEHDIVLGKKETELAEQPSTTAALTSNATVHIQKQEQEVTADQPDGDMLKTKKDEKEREGQGEDIGMDKKETETKNKIDEDADLPSAIKKTEKDSTLSPLEAFPLPPRDRPALPVPVLKTATLTESDSIPQEPLPSASASSFATTNETDTDTNAETMAEAENGKGWRASTLPKTKLSDFIEAMVHHRLRQGYTNIKKKSNTTKECDVEGDNSQESTASRGDEIMKSLTIRVVANASRSMDVPDIIADNLPTAEGHRVPPYFVYRQKCILLFQSIDGIDVCLFCLYVQEFDDSCPEPNKSRVYIAYLDSVEYFRPRHLRTQVYYEIIIAYLKWAQTRGFKFGHIWACPPQRGDNFIFWCHPTQQRTPSRDRLTSWYNAMLSRSKALGICSSVLNLWTCFFEGYGKRDEGLQRHASKNSYVGKQHHTKKASKQSKKKNGSGRSRGGGSSGSSCQSSLLSNTSVTSSSNNNSSHNDSYKSNTPGADDVPICPPVFEGDFWVTECTRVYRLVHTRTQGIRYDKDKTLNQRKCRETLKALMTKPIAYCFNQPVDPVALNIPDYPAVIKKPMDFGTVRDKLRLDSYRSMLEFAQDIRLTCKNAMIYNPPAHVVHNLANQLLNEFETMMSDMVTERVGDIFATSNDVDTWLATYPVNSAMEKEEKKKRAKEQLEQRVLLAGQKTGGDSSCATEVSSSLSTSSLLMSGIASTDTETENVSCRSGTSMTEVDSMMEVDEADVQILDALLEDGDSGATSSGIVDPPSSTLCATRRVSFSSEPEHNIEESTVALKCPPSQQQLREQSVGELDNDEYGFVDYESGQSDSDARPPVQILVENQSQNENDGNGDSNGNDNVVARSHPTSVTATSTSESERKSDESNDGAVISQYNSSTSFSGQVSDEEASGNRDSNSKLDRLEGRRIDGDASQDSFVHDTGMVGERSLHTGSLSRYDSMDSVLSVVEQWPRRPDRTSSMCVEESSMEAFGSSNITSTSTTGNILCGVGGVEIEADTISATQSQTPMKMQSNLSSPHPPFPSSRNNRECLSIDIAATEAVSVGLNSVRRRNGLNTSLPFDKPQLGVKGAQALMSELSRNVCRLKDDMYVLIFAPASSTTTTTTTTTSSCSTSVTTDDSTPSSSTTSKTSHALHDGISPECLRMLEGIVPDTSDPDVVIRSPFIESRQTFLEMCQFRHLQFDSLRRAKYSSSLLIYHLLFPNIKSTRPHCKECKRQIKVVRWHCEMCQIEICNTCKYSTLRSAHQHEEVLTPIRVSYK